jgi:hypothetical protein
MMVMVMTEVEVVLVLLKQSKQTARVTTRWFIFIAMD